MTRNFTTKIAKITLVIGVVVLLFAFFLQTDAVGSTFATGSGTGGLELRIDSKTFYNGVLQPNLSWTLKNLSPAHDKFFNFGDVKPGDTGTNTISIHIKKNPAWVCLDFKNLEDSENGRNEPEQIVDNNEQGELSSELEFFAWRDDGDNKFEIGEKPLFGTSTQSAIQVLKNKSYALADYGTGNAYQPNQTKYIGITWCAGNLTIDVSTAKITCDATAMGNEAQTDSMTLDVVIRAVSSSGQPKFVCNKSEEPEPEIPHCEVEGHKYDENTNPLSGWTMGLMKVVSHNKGIDIYDLATDVTDKNGYFCLDWDGKKQTIRGKSTYKSGPKTVTYRVYEKMLSGWKNIDVERGVDFNNLVQVPVIDIKKEGDYVSVGVPINETTLNTAYHVDFYNYKNVGHGGWSKKDKNKWDKFKDDCLAIWDKAKNYNRS